MIEVWKDIPGYIGEYQVSNMGRVRSLDRTSFYDSVCHYSGRVLKIKRHHKGKILSPGRKPSGHYSVSLGKGNSQDVHRLVLLAFVGDCPDGMECLHYDDDPSNNRLTNLRWGTRAENLHDAVRNGAKKVAEDHHGSKLKNEDIPKIRGMFGKLSYSAIGRIYGVNESTIRQIRDGKSWRSVNG